MTLRVLELFSGVGGWRYAMGEEVPFVAAYDIHPGANATYAFNHNALPLSKDVSSLPLHAFDKHHANTWVMSPPCQPFCRMGTQSDIADKRCAAFLHLLAMLDHKPPENMLLENVVGFLNSRAYLLLKEVLEKKGFQHKAWTLCPNTWGLPNQRPRVYVAASRHSLPILPIPLPPPATPSLAAFLDEVEDDRLYLSPTELRHCPGMDLVKPHDTRSACFIGGYGRRFLGSGSFLVTPRGIRRFSPPEMARLLGYPASFSFPPEVPLHQQYKLLGNGLSLPVAHWVASHIKSI